MLIFFKRILRCVSVTEITIVTIITKLDIIKICAKRSNMIIATLKVTIYYSKVYS